ncbi:type II toxin-antitoxin system RelE/ParE family toxin [bacterium]|nr:type II toxin-antitoxin system RelE/ParE family toxin [bacterium]
MEIITFGNKETENFVKTGKLKKGCKWRTLENIAQRKIDMIIFADSIDDLRVPPSNRLEKLAHNLSGFWSIRINDQFRVVFKCESNKIYKIEIIDYH